MPRSNNRGFRAQCQECGFQSSCWTTSFIAHVEAAGHRERTGHETDVRDGSRRLLER